MARQFRVGVIGRTGRGDYGHELDQAWDAIPNAKVVAVADDDKGGLAKAASRLRVNKTYSDYRKMLDEARPDVVCICQRWLDKHHEMVLAAAQRGMHIYLEKPLCRNLVEADEIVDACERTHVKLVVGHPTRYSPKLDRVKRLIEAGRFGKVLEYRGRGKEDRRGGTEDMWVLGTHVMDMIRAIGGPPKWCSGQLTHEGEPVAKRHVYDGPEGIGPMAGDAVHAMYGMEDGSVAYFSSVKNVAANPTRYGLQIYCSHGIVEILEGTMPRVTCLRDRGWSPLRSGKEWMEVSSAGFGKPEPLKGAKYEARHTLAITDLLRSIEEERQPKGNVYEARGAVEMIVAPVESHRLGKPVALPLANRQNPFTMLEG